jgi:hypothetical protein
MNIEAQINVTTPGVKRDFTAAFTRHGPPQSALAYSGFVFTQRFSNSLNTVEHLPDELGIEQKKFSPDYAGTWDKNELFHQAPKKWCALLLRTYAAILLERPVSFLDMSVSVLK